MAAPTILDTESDYLSDISSEEELLLIELSSKHHQGVGGSAPSTLYNSNACNVDLLPGRTDAIDDESSSVAKGSGVSTGLPTFEPGRSRSLETDVIYPDLSRALNAIANDGDGGSKTLNDQVTETDESEYDRSPLQRFRSYPKRPLTVTDLTAGAWCELQYWYTLTRLPGGRRTKTSAMKLGSTIHKKLEEEVHETVQVDVSTDEDRFGLKLWNFIQGLRTLRETGFTRELEVWGTVQGNFVNGVIDALSHDNPNPKFENELTEQSKIEPNQKSLTSYFAQNGNPAGAVPSPKVYLIDVKTRGSRAPVTKVLLRPAKIQLLLYHRFLSNIAAGRLDFLKLFRRYGLDPDDTFSDAFLAQMVDFDDDIFESLPSSNLSPVCVDVTKDLERQSSQKGAVQVLKHRTLRELLLLVEEEVKLTFPMGRKSMGLMLRVQYLHRGDGSEIDVHDFPVSNHSLDGYLEQYMAWWQGERKAEGVVIEEAFKCRTCEFAPDCSWRNARAEAQVQEARRAQARRQGSKSSVRK
ncbi:Defects-in-morphology protein 1-like, mitochondrial [Metarhizium rileyi]|uniref:Defects-in-morphology protein 1-like, mitochondrial n=1 Tax=Metarhizium rileyi (strain RCEF 4871) TaxID=1649241 RepID=A0A167HYG8_METRR|nr:Defects-in-morphology protein 1-like, mitochondrial [Metarhizium rileyi RCEF 4871]